VNQRVGNWLSTFHPSCLLLAVVPLGRWPEMRLESRPPARCSAFSIEGAENKLRRSNTGRMVHLILKREACLDVGAIRIGSLALAIADLVDDIGRAGHKTRPRQIQRELRMMDTPPVLCV